MFTVKNYVRAQSLSEAYELNQKKNNRVIGGMMFLRLSHGFIDTAIDLSDLGLSGITETKERFEIGAMTTLREAETHEGLLKYSCGAVKDALSDIVGVQFRNMATIGGSLCGRYGFSDILTLFLAMDSYAELYKGGVIPLSEYVDMPHDRDILIRLIIKKVPGKFCCEAVRPERTDFASLNTCFSVLGGEIRAVYGARPMRAMILPDEKHILSSGLSADAISAFAAFAKDTVPTGSNIRGSAEYRSHLVKVLTERNLLKLGGML